MTLFLVTSLAPLVLWFAVDGPLWVNAVLGLVLAIPLLLPFRIITLDRRRETVTLGRRWPFGPTHVEESFRLGDVAGARSDSVRVDDETTIHRTLLVLHDGEEVVLEPRALVHAAWVEAIDDFVNGREPKRPSDFFWVFPTPLFAAVTVLGLAWAGHQELRIRRAEQGSARILEARVEVHPDSDGDRHEAVLRYAYDVNGTSYEGSHAFPLDLLRESRDVLRGLTPGATVPVFYDPNDPADAFLHRTRSFLPWHVTLSGLMLLIASRRTFRAHRG